MPSATAPLRPGARKDSKMLGRNILETAMRRAFELAALGPAGNPNPQVGCVILDPAGNVVAEGWHKGAGTPHAEVAALAALPEEWRGRMHELTAVATLEPCNHTGRTGPCAVALVKAGIGAVAYSVSDPGDASAHGSATLRAAGVETEGGLLEDEGLELLSDWMQRQEATHTHIPAAAGTVTAGTVTGGTGSRSSAPKLPRVTVKWAQTLDGRAAASDGSSQWITGPAARRDVHARRAAADAILVGTGTLLADDPTLTARTDAGDLLVPASEQPIPVVLGHREVPAAARINGHPALEAHGLTAPLTFAGDDLKSHLEALAERGVQSVFVEGGPTVASAFLRARLADEVLIYVAPSLLGGPRVAISDLGIESMAGIIKLRFESIEHLGDDLLLRASIATEDQQENEEGR